jgi:hypothetical protein
MFYFRDLAFFHAPLLVEAAQQWRAGVFPAWNPHLACGAPLAADPNVGTFFPDAWIVPACGGWMEGVKALLLVRLLLLPVVAYAALRRVPLGPLPALGGALLASLAGPVLTLSSFPAHLGGTLLLAPLAVAGFRLRAADPVGAPAAVLLFAACVLAGSPEIALQASALFLVAALGRPVLSSLVRALGCLALGALAAAPQWLPAAALFPRTPRGMGAGLATPPGFLSFPPVRLVELVWPGVLGKPESDAPFAYWGRGLTQGVTPYLLSVAVGLVPLTLIPWALRNRFGRRAVIAAALFVGLAFGRFLPGGAALSGLTSAVRFPEKWMIGVSVCLCLATAAGLAEIPSDSPRPRRASLVLALAILMASAAGLAALAAGRLVPALRSVSLVDPALPPAAELTVRAALRSELVAAIALAAALAVAFAIRSARFRAALPAVLVALGAVERYPRVVGAVPATSLAVFRGLSREAWPALKASEGGRFYYDREGTTAFDARRPFTGTLYGLSYAGNTDVDQFSDLRSRRVAETVQGLAFSDPRKLRLLRLSGVRAVDTPDPSAEGSSALQLLERRPVGRNLYRLEGGASARLLHRVIPASGAPEAFRLLLEPDFDPERAAVVEGAPPLEEPSGKAAVFVSPLRWLRPDAFELDLSSDRPAFLELSVSWDPHWRLTVDDEPADAFPTDVAFMGVATPAGKHRVAGRYRDPWFAVGALTAAASLGLLAFWTRAVRRRSANGATGAPRS